MDGRFEPELTPMLDRVPGVGALYIGGIISMQRRAALANCNITHVVSALRGPLDRDLYAKYEHLVVELDDLEDEDIVQHFATTNSFIRGGLAGDGGVLVHCAMGKSRSATIVIAYMLHQSPGLTPTEALERLRTVRLLAEPNPGFMTQLELYHTMGRPEDVTSHPQYQRWLYQREVEASLACGRPPETIRFEDEALAASPGSSRATRNVDVRCRKCRRSLATAPYLVEHEPRQSSGTLANETPVVTSFPNTAEHAAASAPAACAHVFVDALSWMRPELEQGKLEGKLQCPNERCRGVVGKYAWQGMRCSCGGWIVPAFSLAKSRVDQVQPRTAPLALSGKI